MGHFPSPQECPILRGEESADGSGEPTRKARRRGAGAPSRAGVESSELSADFWAAVEQRESEAV